MVEQSVSSDTERLHPASLQVIRCAQEDQVAQSVYCNTTFLNL